jgi:hypothetical protein
MGSLYVDHFFVKDYLTLKIFACRKHGRKKTGNKKSKRQKMIKLRKSSGERKTQKRRALMI